MDKAIAKAISAVIVVFGVCILVAGIGSGLPALWTCVAVIVIAIARATLHRRSDFWPETICHAFKEP
ncbi:hypothetical protein [Bradyrhizobium barranii]